MKNLEELVFESVPIGLAYCENRKIIRCNQFFASIFATDIEHLQKHSLSDIYPSNKESFLIGNKAFNGLKENGIYHDERIMRRFNGDLFWCRVRGKALNQKEPFAETVWSFSDLSEERPLVELKLRERQVAMLLCQGKTTKEIGEELYLSPRTIDVYRARLLDIYSAKNSIELIKYITGL